jgi:hypothetical protein
VSHEIVGIGRSNYAAIRGGANMRFLKDILRPLAGYTPNEPVSNEVGSPLGPLGSA